MLRKWKAFYGYDAGFIKALPIDEVVTSLPCSHTRTHKPIHWRLVIMAIFSSLVAPLFAINGLRLTPDRGLDLLAGPDPHGGTHRPRSRYGVPDPANLHWHTYGAILKHKSDWLAVGNVLNKRIITAHQTFTQRCLEIRCCQTYCLDFAFKEGLRVVSDEDNFIRSPKNFPDNWPEMKGFHCPQIEK